MYQLEEHPLASEVGFAEVFQSTVRRLSQQCRARNPSGKQAAAAAASVKGKPNLGALAGLASAASSSVTVGTAVEKVRYLLLCVDLLFTKILSPQNTNLLTPMPSKCSALGNCNLRQQDYL